MSEEPESRGSWGGKFDFVLTMLGYAVGLGNVWRFPYLCYQNGGGAFLIPYIIMVALVGIPIFFLELSFGQFASLGPIAVWRISPFFKGIGFAMVIVTTYIVLYYNVIVAWCLHFFLSSMTSELPWEHCNNWWNTEVCVEPSVDSPVPRNISKTPTEEYFYNYVLRISGGIDEGGSIVWQLALLLFLVWLIVFGVLFKGMKSVGRASYFVSLFPYVLLTALLIQGAMLPGAGKGIEFYMKPDFERLGDLKVWSDAATQIFFSLGCCMGSLHAMASFNDFNHKIIREAVIIPIVNGCSSVYAGFVIFSVLGYMAELKGVPVSEVAAEGPGLVFVVYPEGLTTLPVAPLWSVLFFFMMSTLGFSTQFSLSESICSAIMDEFPNVLRVGNRPTVFRLFFCIIGFLITLPMTTEGGFYLFKLMDDFSAGYPLLIIGFMELTVISWVYPYQRFAKDIALMLGTKPSIFWRICWSFLSPTIVLAVIISKAIDQGPLQFDGDVFPDWAHSLAWVVVAFPLVTIVLFMVLSLCSKEGKLVLKKATSPATDWGPALAENRTGHYGPQFGLDLYTLDPYPSLPYGLSPSNGDGQASKSDPMQDGASGIHGVVNHSYAYDEEKH